MTSANAGTRFDRLPRTAADRTVEGRPSRAAVLAWWRDRYGLPPSTFDDHSFWEKGAGKIWAFAGEVPDPIAVETLGLHVLRTRQDHWKPTTDAVQRFGTAATRNVLVLGDPAAGRFLRGDTQSVAWEGEWGYLIVAHDLAGAVTPIGVGLYLDGELRSQLPKGRRRQV